MSKDLDYFKNLDSVPENPDERDKLNNFLLGPTTTRLGIRQNIYRKFGKPLVDFIVYVRNNKGTWDKGKLLYCHLKSPTSDVKLMNKSIPKKYISDDNILTENRYIMPLKHDILKNWVPLNEKKKINSADTVDLQAYRPRANIQEPYKPGSSFEEESDSVDPNADTPRGKPDPSAEKIIIPDYSVDTVDSEADTSLAKEMGSSTENLINRDRENPDRESIFLPGDEFDEEKGGRKKRTRKQKQKPSRKGKKTKKSRFSAKKSRRNRKNKRKGKTNRRNN